MPEEQPMGNETESELLKQNPRAPYAHWPQVMREHITQGQFIELHISYWIPEGCGTGRR